MPSPHATREVEVELGRGFTLTLQSVGLSKRESLWDHRGEPDDSDAEPLQLLENCEYIYTLDGPSHITGALTLEPSELFSPDDSGMRRGRLRPREQVGRVEVEVHVDSERVGGCALEVRSRKLDYQNHYRWMMRDIASYASEALMSQFAASSQRFVVDASRSAEARYQRLEFLRALLEDEAFVESLEQILQRPHITWRTRTRLEDVRHHADPRALSRAIAKPGPKHRAPSHFPVSHIPAMLTREVSLETVDNAPNRFVKFALESWLMLVLDAERELGERARRHITNPIRRGLRLTGHLARKLDDWLRRPLFQKISPMAEFPVANQVLHKHQAYRKIWQTFLQTELASKLAWDEEHDRVVGVRDVATLYEYWVFLCLLQICERICTKTRQPADLFRLKASGMHLSLQAGQQARYIGEYRAQNQRSVSVRLYYNRTFNNQTVGGSWTYHYKPDVSLELILEGAEEAASVFVHFDSKYKIDGRRRRGRGPENQGVEPKQDDLNKMHAYHDAIRRSAGSFVLYPGTSTDHIRRLDTEELLPGIGAYPLIPSHDPSAIASGVEDLEGFIISILEHAATPTTRRDRARYWFDETYEGEPKHPSDMPWSKPPEDAFILLGYVKSREHLAWIKRHRLYNLRADPGRAGSVGFDSNTLQADTLLLYGEGTDAPEYFRLTPNAPQVFSAQMLSQGDYPNPGGSHYFVRDLEPLDIPPLLADIAPKALRDCIEQCTDGTGAPIAHRWSSWLDALGISP